MATPSRQQEGLGERACAPALPRLREDLRAAFGRRTAGERPAIEALILGLAGAADCGGERAAEALKRGFRPWTRLLNAPPELVAAALRSVEPDLGRALHRAERLGGAMRRLAARSGGLSLEFLARMSPQEAWAWLEDVLALPPALIALVLSSPPIGHRLVHPKPEAMRALDRLGLTEAADAVKAGITLAQAAPAGWTGGDLAELSALLQALGESLCHRERPECGVCPASAFCPSAAVGAVLPGRGGALRPIAYLRRRIARIQGGERPPEQTGLRLGEGPFSPAVLPHGLSCGVHQAAPSKPMQGCAPLILAIAAAGALERRERCNQAREGPAGAVRRRAPPPPAAQTPVRLLFIQETDATLEHGEVFPPGLSALGVDPASAAFVSVGSGAEVLRVTEEALKLRAAPVLVAELRRGAGAVDLAVTRRLNLAARRAGAVLVLITPDLSNTSAALTRWRIGAAPSRALGRRLGPPAFTFDLVRNRLGPPGAWTVEWDLHEQRFRNPQPLAAEPPSRSAGRPLPAPHLPPPVDRSAVAAAGGGDRAAA